jgi:sodium transport system ATP-binding protein
VIEARSLAKNFGKVAAVRDVSLRANDGRITGLLGPNGAGKSTTLRILYTVLRPDSGDAVIDGVSVTGDPLEARRRIGVLSHGAGIYPNLTARENILYFGALHGLSRREREMRTTQLIELLEMGEFADRIAKGFSQGQKIKAALARAIIHRPRNVLRLKEEGHCVLFSSHVMQEVAALCDEVVVIAHGTVAATGSPEDIRVQTGESTLEDAFVRLIGTGEGLG